MRPKGHAILNAGDRMIMGLGGGAGYGNPMERPIALVEKDIRQKKITLEKAKELYGYGERE